MKKTGIIAAVVALAMLFSGCSSLVTGQYSSVVPHLELNNSTMQETVEVTTTTQLQEVILEMVAGGQEGGVVYVSGMNAGRLETVMQLVVHNVLTYDPIGAFAVEKIDYDVGTSTGRAAIAVNITYSRSRGEILRILQAEDMDSAVAVVTEALEDCVSGIVVKVEDYQEMDLAQRVQDYADAHPDTCMETPQVTVSVYPDTGSTRVIELTFLYQTSRDVLRSMQTYVYPVFRAADLNVSEEDEESVKFSRMYAFLMERNEYQLETSITPAYSLLRHGVGDSKAFATVYAAMCRNAGLECMVISGTRSGEPWSWNLICQDGNYYHVDLIASNRTGRLTRLTQEDMVGYVWDYSAYPTSETQKEKNTSIDQQAKEATEAETEDPIQEEVAKEVTAPETEPAELETTESAG